MQPRKEDDPDPMWDEMHTVPRCSESDCRQFDGKRCKLMGFEPDGICEPAVAQMSEAIQIVLANKSMDKTSRETWLLWGIDMTKEQFKDMAQ